MGFHKQVSSESIQFTKVSFSILWAPRSRQFCSYWNSCTIFDLVMDTFNVHIKWRGEGGDISLPAPRSRVSQLGIWRILNGSVLTSWSWKSDLAKSRAQLWWQAVRQVAAHPLAARGRERDLLSGEVNGKRKGQLLEGKNNMWSEGTGRNVRMTREDNFSLMTVYWKLLARDLWSEAVPHAPNKLLILVPHGFFVHSRTPWCEASAALCWGVAMGKYSQHFSCGVQADTECGNISIQEACLNQCYR